MDILTKYTKKKERIKFYNARIQSLNMMIDELTKIRQEVENSKNEEDLEKILFYLYSEKDLNPIDPNNEYNNFFYDAITEEVIIITSSNIPKSDYPLVVNTKELITDEKDYTEENLEIIKNKINKYIEYLIKEYEPTEMLELFTLITNGMQTGEFNLITKNLKLIK